MLTSSDKRSGKNGKNRRNCFSTSFSVLFCCVSKNKSQLNPRVASSSVQCDIPIPLNSTKPEDALKDDFKSSLNKLDSLINTLQDIKEKYRKNDCASKDQNKIQALESTNSLKDNEITKFNVSINERACIECITRKGKHSLTIFNTKSTYASGDNESVLDLNGVAERASEQTLKNVASLQNDYHTLSENFGRFTSAIGRHVSNLRKDVRFLRSIMGSIECKFGGKMMMNQMSRMEVNRKEKSMMQSEEFKFVQAKLRASTFCRFYNMRHNRKTVKKITTKKEGKHTLSR